MARTLTTTPDARIINGLYDITCGRVAWIARFVTYRYADTVVFGKETMSLSEFCEKWKDFPANSFVIRVWAGPPDKMKWYKISLSAYAVDWYFRALERGNKYTVSELERMFNVAD